MESSYYICIGFATTQLVYFQLAGQNNRVATYMARKKYVFTNLVLTTIAVFTNEKKLSPIVYVFNRPAAGF